MQSNNFIKHNAIELRWSPSWSETPFSRTSPKPFQNEGVKTLCLCFHRSLTAGWKPNRFPRQRRLWLYSVHAQCILDAHSVHTQCVLRACSVHTASDSHYLILKHCWRLLKLTSASHYLNLASTSHYLNWHRFRNELKHRLRIILINPTKYLP